MDIDHTAVISKKARLADQVKIGPFSVIKEGVQIEEGTQVDAHCIIEGNTKIGKRCRIFAGTVLGSAPQDLKYKGEQSYLEIGQDNIIREYCTFNRGTGEGGKTLIGNNNLFMAYSHVAHDCLIGNNCVVANCGTLAGHVKIQDQARIGGLVAIHQFVTIGKLSIIGGCSKVVQDIPPYSTCDGHPTKVYGINLVGLKRAGFSQELIKDLSRALKIIFNSGFSIKHAIEKVSSSIKPSPELNYLIDFVKKSKRGICHGIK